MTAQNVPFLRKMVKQMTQHFTMSAKKDLDKIHNKNNLTRLMLKYNSHISYMSFYLCAKNIT